MGGRNRRRRSRTGAEGGQAVVEFALLLPVLLILLFGTIEFGRVFLSYLVVVDAAHDAARVASLGGTTSAATAAADSAVQMAGLNGANLTVDVSGTQSGGEWVSGTSISVSASYPVPIIVPLFWPVLGQTFTVQTSVTMLEEG